MHIKRTHRTTDAFGEMSREPFTSRSAGVLFWGAGYLVTAIAWGAGLALLWPQGEVCTETCGARIEAGVIAVSLLLLGGLAGLVVAVWLGVRRRATAPRRLMIGLAAALVAALIAAVALDGAAASGGDEAGLATVRSAWSWGLAVPASALLATSLLAALRARVRSRAMGSARVRRA
jgi:hypothetical protein